MSDLGPTRTTPALEAKVRSLRSRIPMSAAEFFRDHPNPTRGASRDPGVWDGPERTDAEWIEYMARRALQ